MILAMTETQVIVDVVLAAAAVAVVVVVVVLVVVLVVVVVVLVVVVERERTWRHQWDRWVAEGKGAQGVGDCVKTGPTCWWARAMEMQGTVRVCSHRGGPSDVRSRVCCRP